MQQQQSKKVDDEIVINLGEILKTLLHRWWILLICLVVGVAAGFACGKIMHSDAYTVQAVYLVTYSGDENGSSSNITNDYNAVKTVLNNCVEVANRNRFYSQATELLNDGVSENSESFLSAKTLSSYVSFSTNTTDNTLMYVNVTTGNGELTYKIINTICGQTVDGDGERHTFLSDYIKDNYTKSGIKDLDFSLINDLEYPSSPDADSTVIKYTAIGGVGCFVLGILVVALLQIFSQMVKGEDDLTSRYHLPVLASVPNFEDKQLIKGEYGYGTDEK